MNIDIRTLILIIGVTHLIQVLVFYYQFKINKVYKGIGWWLMWSAAEVIGFLAILFRDIQAIRPIVIMVQNTSIIAGSIFIYIGLMRFLDKPVNLKFIVPVFSTYLSMILFFLFVKDDIYIRSLVINLTLAVIPFFTAYSLYSSKISIIRTSVIFNTVVMFLHGCTFTFRFVMIVSGTPVTHFFAPTLFNLVPFLDALIVSLLWTFGFIVMINQRLHTEMKEAKDDFEMIFQVSPDATVITGMSDGRIIRVNRGFSEISGYTSEESVGKLSRDFLWKNMDDRDKVILELTAKGYCENFETTFHRKNGTELSGLMSARTYAAQGVSAIISVTRDITGIKEKEKELFELKENLEKMVVRRTEELQVLVNEQKANQIALVNLVEDLNEKTDQLKQTTAQLEAANKELETFTYSVSHDLKAPLRGIEGYSKLLFETYKNRLDEEGNNFLQKIRGSTLMMNQLIDDLLNYSRLERSQVRLQKISTRDLFASLLSIYQDELTKSRFNVEVPAGDVEIEADLNGLTIALRNLVENAIKFSGNSSNPSICMDVEEGPSSWVIRVKDNGIGFDMRYSRKIFDIFQRLHRAEDFPGTGIGLAMVNKAMQRMNGKAWAESVPGTGSVFSLEIPKNFNYEYK